jgi:hypothetical protein
MSASHHSTIFDSGVCLTIAQMGKKLPTFMEPKGLLPLLAIFSECVMDRTVCS